MDSTPAVDASSVITSAFGNLAFLKIVRFVHWELAYADGVAFTTLPIPA